MDELANYEQVILMAYSRAPCGSPPTAAVSQQELGRRSIDAINNPTVDCRPNVLAYSCSRDLSRDCSCKPPPWAGKQDDEHRALEKSIRLQLQ